ncbi:MAG: C40 family peptidase [Elusimicrobia bacterium]|nr:C40 family peptidase [Elusimicrobiota bacterium]
MKIQFKNNIAVFIIVLVILLTCQAAKASGEKLSLKPRQDYNYSLSGVPRGGSVTHKRILKLIDKAIGYLGTSYIYGGATVKIGLDCSGLVMAAFRAADINLPRTSQARKRIGSKVSLEDVRPGDLVFFYGRGFDSRRINHVGIYLGSGDFIHSSQSEGEVAIDNLESNSYYRKKIAEIRRIINEQPF